MQADEERRLAVLRQYELLDTPPETVYDAMVRTASEIAQTPIAVISLIDRNRQWFKAKLGIDFAQCPRDDGFCAHLLHHDDPLIVQDARSDVKLADNPMVAGEPHVRFYAGFPLKSREGAAMGGLCVADRIPRILAETQIRALRKLSIGLVAILEARRQLVQHFHGEHAAAQEQIDVLLSAMNVAGDSIIVYEVDAHGELRLAYANHAYYQESGYEPAEAMGKPLEFFRRQMPDDPGMRRVREAIARGHEVKTEVCSYRKDGRSYWNQVTLQPIRGASGTITHWIAVERDVTEAIERESHLEDRNARLMTLSEAARSLFGALELPELERRLNAAVHDLVSGSAALYTIDSERNPDQLLLRAQSGKRSVTDEGQRRVVLPADASHVIDVRRARPLTPSDVLLLELLAQYYAVAAHNASLVSEIEEQRNAVLELNQVKTDLIAMLAHDFKGPLTNILGYADLTAEMGELNDHQQEYVEAIRRAALRLADLATDTLAISRLERNEIDLSDEPLDLAELLREVAEANEVRAVELHIEADPPLRGDLRRLRQVFYNLVENAIKYSPNGEPVSIRAFEREDVAVVEVADRGIGIPRQDLGRIFDRFSRASNARKMRIAGTGFGLFLAHQIVEMHGGHIEVESEEGRGSVFRVLLPIAGHEHLARPLRVAVVEAHSEARSFITHALREAGLRTRLLSSLEALFDEDIFETDRVVVDFDAVNITEDVMRKLEEFARTHGAKIVLVGSDPPAFGGGVQILRKPYLMRDLIDAVQSSTSTRFGAE